RLSNRAHPRPIALPDDCLDLVASRWNLDLNFGSESIVEHGRVAWVRQVQFHRLFQPVNISVVLIKRNNHKVEEVFVTGILFQKWQSLNADLSQQRNLIPALIQLKIVIRELNGNLVEVPWRL